MEPFARVTFADSSGAQPIRMVARNDWRSWSNANAIVLTAFTPPEVARNDVGTYFRRAEEQHDTVFLESKVDKPVWATEFGWLIDPAARSLEVLSLEAGRWTPSARHADAAKVRAVPFDALELEIHTLWS